jgi:hypothetical protein
LIVNISKFITFNYIQTVTVRQSYKAWLIRRPRVETDFRLARRHVDRTRVLWNPQKRTSITDSLSKTWMVLERAIRHYINVSSDGINPKVCSSFTARYRFHAQLGQERTSPIEAGILVVSTSPGTGTRCLCIRYDRAGNAGSLFYDRFSTGLHVAACYKPVFLTAALAQGPELRVTALGLNFPSKRPFPVLELMITRQQLYQCARAPQWPIKIFH